MSASIFADKNKKPTDKMLKVALGKTYAFWEGIKKHILSEYGKATEDWKFYNVRSGWLLKTLLKKRNLFFFVPVEDYFKLSFIFGDKAVEAVVKSDLPENIKTTLRNAKKYMEGRGLSIDVKTSEDVEITKKLVDIKINN
jgi:hypothetical protein